ncbi:MAG TPA: hypothetical protein VH854_04750, partial [Thermoanaerobaculia bacterium]|nr:hypothetical protein [Thermoanaerobaculia bacterium]
RSRLSRTVLRAAAIVGALAGFVAGVDLLRALRPALLVDPEPAWAVPRLLLGLAVAAAAAGAGALAAGLYAFWAREPASRAPLRPLAGSRLAFALLAAGAVCAGAALRFAALSRIPEPLWIDDASLIPAALELSGRPSDFADAIRPAPFGVAKPYGSVGVLYLEGFRASLRGFGATVFGVRFPAALAGSLSIATGALLGASLLPAGGGALTALALAGMRGHLILSRWSWCMIVLVPIVDLATLALVHARRRRSAGLALLGGAIAGIGAHVYLAAWPAAAGLGLFALWPAAPARRATELPDERPERRRERLGRAALFALGFALAASPIFLLRSGRTAPYFARTSDHNVRLEIARSGSLLPPFAAAADTLAAPWLIPDPIARHDLPGRSRLGWLLGIPAAIALARSLIRPRDGLSALVLAQTVAVLAATVAGGQADHPNGARFAYLTTLAALCAAAGLIWLAGLAPGRLRSAAAIAAAGVLVVAGALGARDALRIWPDRPETFDGFHGQDTLIGRAAARWDRYGDVGIASGLGHSPLTIGAVRRWRLDPDAAGAPSARRGFRVRIAAPGDAGGEGERRVETIADPRGTEWAVVWAAK